MPFEGQFDNEEPFIEVLNNQFLQADYDNVLFMSAWTRRWAIQELMVSLRDYLNGGGRFTLYTGNSFRSTSIEAIELLMELAVDFPSQVHIFVCAQPTGSFHPKVYVYLDSDTQTSWLSVGSSNLTRGGMYTNIEANLISTDWDDTLAVVTWWRERPDSGESTPSHSPTYWDGGRASIASMFRTEDEISNQTRNQEK